MNLPLPFLKKTIKFSELTSFTRQFSAMSEARISLVRILDILSMQTQSALLKKILTQVKNEVQAGKSLAEAFSKYPKIFSTFYLNMIKVGEMTGRLDYMLNRVALYLEKINSLRRKLIQSLSYPTLVVVVAVGAVAFLLTYVVPSFADMFRDFDAELPAITLMLMKTSNFVTSKLWLILLLIIAVAFGVRAYLRTRSGIRLKDTLIIVFPISGPIIKKNYISRFSRTLSILLESGIPLLDALQVTNDSISNVVVQQEIKQMHFFAEKGEMLTHTLKKSKIFPPMVTQMVLVGEETAKLDQMLGRVADFYDDEIEATLTNLSSILEPIIIIILGVIIGTILIALYMPLFDLVNIIPE